MKSRTARSPRELSRASDWVSSRGQSGGRSPVEEPPPLWPPRLAVVRGGLLCPVGFRGLSRFEALSPVWFPAVCRERECPSGRLCRGGDVRPAFSGPWFWVWFRASSPTSSGPVRTFEDRTERPVSSATRPGHSRESGRASESECSSRRDPDGGPWLSRPGRARGRTRWGQRSSGARPSGARRWPPRYSRGRAVPSDTR